MIVASFFISLNGYIRVEDVKATVGLNDTAYAPAFRLLNRVKFRQVGLARCKKQNAWCFVYVEHGGSKAREAFALHIGRTRIKKQDFEF